LKSRITLIVDQAIFSLTTMVATVVGARNLGASAFGILALYIMAHGLVAAGARAIGTDFLQLHAGRHAVLSATSIRPEVHRVRLKSLALGALLAGVFAVPLWRDASWLCLIAVGVLVPSMLADSARNIFIALSRYKTALLLDVLIGLTTIGTFTLAGRAHSEWSIFLICWAGIQGAWGLIGQCLTSVLVSRLPQERQAAVDSSLARTFGAEYLLGVVAVQAPLLTATWLVGPVAAGALRGADTFVGPLRILSTALIPIALRRMASIHGARGWLREVFVLSAPLIVLTVLWAGIVLKLPSSVGRQVLGDTWPVAHRVVPVILAGFLAIIVTTFSATALKAAARGRYLIRARLASASLSVSLGIAGAALFGATGVAWSMCIVSWLSMVLWLLGILREPVRSKIGAA
jgi:O-antigen/teichoic acid export membrane protein